jgi:uncharacterized GH25 family protein
MNFEKQDWRDCLEKYMENQASKTLNKIKRKTVTISQFGTIIEGSEEDFTLKEMEKLKKLDSLASSNEAPQIRKQWKRKWKNPVLRNQPETI